MAGRIGPGKFQQPNVFSASLASAGAFTATTGSACEDFAYAAFHIQYVTGSAAGAVKFYFQTSPDGSNWFDLCIKDGNSVASGSTGGLTSTVDTDITKIPAQGNCNKVFNTPIFGAKQIRAQIAEYGVTGSAGSAVAFFVVKDKG